MYDDDEVVEANPAATKKSRGFDKWQVEHALECILAAKKAMKDASLMKAVKALAKTKLEDEKNELIAIKALASGK
jgi:hypothetical protein